MNKVHLLTVASFLLLAAFNVAPVHNIEAAQTAVVVTTDHSKAECVSIAQKICGRVFGKCSDNAAGAIGGEPGYLVMYQCHDVRMSFGRVTALVIAGSRNEGTSPEKLSGWMTQSYDLAE